MEIKEGSYNVNIHKSLIAVKDIDLDKVYTYSSDEAGLNLMLKNLKNFIINKNFSNNKG